MPEPQPDQDQQSNNPNVPAETDWTDQFAFYSQAGLVEVLRKRLEGLKEAYDGLEDYTRSVEAARRTVQAQLEAAQAELKRWQSNRGVRLGRTFALLGRNVQQSLAVSSGAITNALHPALKIQLDAPAAGATIKSELALSGWVAGNLPANWQVEVYLGETQLGLAETGLPRWDVIESQPWQTRTDCGFAARFSLDLAAGQVQTGKNFLKVQLKDSNNTLLEIERPVQVEADPSNEQQQLYTDWLRRTGMVGWDFLAQRATSEKWLYQPLITLGICIPQETTPAHFAALLDSMQAQTYRRWEVVVLMPAETDPALRDLAKDRAREDKRIHLQSVKEDAAPLDLLETAQGDFVAWPAADALLSQDALFKTVEILNQHPGVNLLYSDEDTLDAAGNRTAPQFKPDWSPELFYSRPYTGQLTFYRHEALQEVLKEAAGAGTATASIEGGSSAQPDASGRLYDLTLRLLEKHGPFHHLSAVIYHSRHSLNLGQPLDPAFGIVLGRHFERAGRSATLIEPGLLPATLHYRYALPEPRPTVSLIIPTRDQSEVLRRCLDSIFKLTTYPDYEVIVVDNASHQAETHQYFAELAPNPRFRRLSFDGPFNFAAINNYAAAQARGELLLFLNNDTEVITPGWLEELAAFAVQPEIGAVGARLLFPDDTIQHAGVVVGLLGIADHILKGIPASAPGPLGLAKTVKDVSALTAACLMTRRDLFFEVGGFDEENLPVAFNDVDLCLKLRERGLRLVWTPYAELYHHESVSRGLDSSIEKEARLHREITCMFGRWPDSIARDPYYNPNLSRNRLDYTVSER